MRFSENRLPIQIPEFPITQLHKVSRQPSVAGAEATLVPRWCQGIVVLGMSIGNPRLFTANQVPSGKR